MNSIIRHFFGLYLIIILAVFNLFHTGPSYAKNNARGRVSISNGTMVTDRGTLLRGCRVSTDLTEQLPARSDISGIKQHGLNAIHLYAESFVKHVPGELHSLVDSLVNWTEEDSLYLVLTIGCNDQNGYYNYDFAMGFWNYYAPRYADKTHLIYEIHNEPHAWAPPYPDSTLAMEQDAYDIIRASAPQTHILLFSYATPTNSEGIFQDIQKLGNHIDWTNASVATHGYGVEYDELESVIQDVQNAGYSVINTEPCYLEIDKDYSVNLFRQQIRVHENNHISYLHFLDAAEIKIPGHFQTIIEESGLQWTPDFGSWPPPVIWDAFSQIEAEYFSRQGGPSGVRDLGNKIGFVSNGDYVIYHSVNFGEGATEFRIHTASGGIGGTVEIRLDSTTGFIAGQAEIDTTGGWDNWVTKACRVTDASGVHDLVLQFAGGIWDLFDIDWFQFTPVPSTVYDKAERTSAAKTNRLFQNYPNPFNESTVIRYNLIEEGLITLTLYNLEGQTIETLYHGHQTAGNHELKWTAEGLSNGIYFYQLRKGDFSEIRKLILQK